MKVYRIIADKKPSSCIECPLIRLRVCGEVSKERATSGAIYYVSIPDDRCLIRAKKQ